MRYLGLTDLLDEGLALLEELAGEDDDGGGAVAHLGVLALGDVYEGLGRGVHDVEQLHDGGAVVGDGGGAPRVNHELVHSPGPEGGAHGVRNGLQGCN